MNLLYIHCEETRFPKLALIEILILLISKLFILKFALKFYLKKNDKAFHHEFIKHINNYNFIYNNKIIMRIKIILKLNFC